MKVKSRKRIALLWKSLDIAARTGIGGWILCLTGCSKDGHFTLRNNFFFENMHQSLFFP